MSLTENPIATLKSLWRVKAMGFFSSPKKLLESPQVVGVDLGHAHLLVLGLDRQGEKLEISNFRLEDRPATEEAISERLRAIFNEEGLNTKNVRIALRGQGVVIRILTFPQMKKEEFASAVRYEIEKYIPFKSNEVALDFQILRENITRGDSHSMEVLLVAVKQSEIYQLLRIFQNADLQVKLIDISAFAVANFVEFIFPETKDTTVAYLDMGTETSTFGILSQGRPSFIREVSFGGADLSKLLKRKLGLEGEALLGIQPGSPEFTPEYRAVLEQGLEAFSTELKLSLAYYADHVPNAEPIQTLFLVGGGARFIPDLSFLESAVKTPSKRPEFLSKIRVHSKVSRSLVEKNEDVLPVVLGLCLRP